MGSNFHTPWVDGTTAFEDSLMNAPLVTLDQALTYLKNLIVHCDGNLDFNTTTGQFTWSGTIRIVFNRSDGNVVYNQVTASNIVLTAGNVLYCDLSETNGATITLAQLTPSYGNASTILAYNRLVLGIRNATNGEFFPAVAGMAAVVNAPGS